MAKDYLTSLNGKEVTKIQIVPVAVDPTKPRAQHYNMNFYTEGDKLFQVFSYTNEDEMKRVAESYGATQFDVNGEWKPKK